MGQDEYNADTANTRALEVLKRVMRSRGGRAGIFYVTAEGKSGGKVMAFFEREKRDPTGLKTLRKGQKARIKAGRWRMFAAGRVTVGEDKIVRFETTEKRGNLRDLKKALYTQLGGPGGGSKGKVLARFFRKGRFLTPEGQEDEPLLAGWTEEQASAVDAADLLELGLDRAEAQEILGQAEWFSEQLDVLEELMAAVGQAEHPKEVAINEVVQRLQQLEDEALPEKKFLTIVRQLCDELDVPVHTIGEVLEGVAKGDLTGVDLQPLMKMVIKLTWQIGEVDPAYPRFTGDDFRAMEPRLKPGMILLNGAGGGLSHSALYVGNGEIIHSMGTEHTKLPREAAVRQYIEATLLDVPEPHVGVLREKAADFFDRYHRDTVVAVDGGLSEAEVAAGIEEIQGYVGLEYDYALQRDSDRPLPEHATDQYCTELMAVFFDAAKEGLELPTMTQSFGEASGLKLLDKIPAFKKLEVPPVIDPALMLTECPWLTPVCASGTATKKFAEHIESVPLVGG